MVEVSFVKRSLTESTNLSNWIHLSLRVEKSNTKKFPLPHHRKGFFLFFFLALFPIQVRRNLPLLPYPEPTSIGPRGISVWIHSERFPISVSKSCHGGFLWLGKSLPKGELRQRRWHRWFFGAIQTSPKSGEKEVSPVSPRAFWVFLGWKVKKNCNFLVFSHFLDETVVNLQRGLSARKRKPPFTGLPHHGRTPCFTVLGLHCFAEGRCGPISDSLWWELHLFYLHSLWISAHYNQNNFPFGGVQSFVLRRWWIAG